MSERQRLVAALRRIHPFGNYCEKPCKHPAHTNDAYRATLARYGVEMKVADAFTPPDPFSREV